MLVLVYLRMSRSRKRKDGWDPNELTTEEGLLEVVSTRKILRKINYDAMSVMADQFSFMLRLIITSSQVLHHSCS
jgi:hypothetical protein